MRPRVLVVYKKSTYQRYVGRAQARLQELIEHSDVSVDGLLHEHEVHQASLHRAKQALRDLGARAVLRYRPEPMPEEGAWDMIVTLGGDGTLLWASHLADSSTPMLAINSAPDTSVGYFCAGNGNNVAEVLAAALDGTLKSTRLSRMRVDVEDKLISTRVLNDLLYCHESPAATSRYILSFGGDQERQMSSGVWVGPAAGSTAAIRSAGGTVLPIGSQKIQFVVREPYRGVDQGHVRSGRRARDQQPDDHGPDLPRRDAESVSRRDRRPNSHDLVRRAADAPGPPSADGWLQQGPRVEVN